MYTYIYIYMHTYSGINCAHAIFTVTTFYLTRVQIYMYMQEYNRNVHISIHM